MAKKSKPNGQAGPARRPSQQELLHVKDRVLVRMAKRYADDMYSSDELIVRAKKEKQAIHTRMSNLDALHFTAHGYEFERAPGEERFIARKIKRGPQAETSADAASGLTEDEIDEGGGL